MAALSPAFDIPKIISFSTFKSRWKNAAASISLHYLLHRNGIKARFDIDSMRQIYSSISFGHDYMTHKTCTSIFLCAQANVHILCAFLIALNIAICNIKNCWFRIKCVLSLFAFCILVLIVPAHRPTTHIHNGPASSERWCVWCCTSFI